MSENPIAFEQRRWDEMSAAEAEGRAWQPVRQRSAEQQARDMLEQCGVEDAQSFTAGDVVALANFIADANRLRATVEHIRHLATAYTPDPGLVEDILRALDH
jgi:hypothetical protein